MWYSSRRLAEAASKRPRKWPSTSKSGRIRPFASWPTGSGMLVKLCSPGEALGVGLRCLSFLDFGLAANTGSIATAIDKSKIDNKQTAKPKSGQFTRLRAPATAAQARTGGFSHAPLAAPG